ncbi:MAG: hypothetical protein ACWA6U_18430, partial [Breznakibacter sp.]
FHNRRLVMGIQGIFIGFNPIGHAAHSPPDLPMGNYPILYWVLKEICQRTFWMILATSSTTTDRQLNCAM